MSGFGGPGAAFSNVYDDPHRAQAYASLEFPGTYYLAFRDVPAILAAGAGGREALDFGCGAGRSTRFLKSLGFRAFGIDISKEMIRLARSADADGDYRLVAQDGFGAIGPRSLDLVFSAFAFDNIPGRDERRELLRRLGDLLRPGGRIVLICSTPEIYTHEWASFSTRAFPENARATGGDEVRIVMKDVTDARPVVDVIWFPNDYRALFEASGLELEARHEPLGSPSEPYAWISETEVAPWVVYVLAKP